MDGLLGSLYLMLALGLALIVLVTIARWRIFEKAGQPGWASLVPFYDTYVLIVNVLGLPPYCFWLLLIPIVNIVVIIPLVFIIPFKLAEKFGKGVGFGFGLLFFGVVFVPVLAFGGAEYMGGESRSRRLAFVDDEKW
jgi:hypothetical protein